ncbi:ribosome recycling factor [Chloroflexota bacterium]
MIKDILIETDTRMKASIVSLEEDLSTIRTGRANPALVERLLVDYFNVPTPLLQLASISVPESRSLLIRPFDPSTVKVIEKAILSSDLGLTPSNDGKSIRLNLPPLTEDRRIELVKHMNGRLEEARIAVRNIRRDGLEDMRESEREKLVSKDDLERGEKDLQEVTDRFIENIRQIGLDKEQEIMEV